MPAQHTAWTREEHILAVKLYCKIPFHKIHTRNPRAVQVARMLGRSVGSVSLKLSNFARLDLALPARDIRGMSQRVNNEPVRWLKSFADARLLLPKQFAPDTEFLKHHAEKCLTWRTSTAKN